MQDLIRLENIVKVYPPNVMAVDDVSLSFRRGEIHSLVGENGAGKSTLMKIVYGMVPRDAGRMYLDDRPIVFHNPEEAISRGIGMVHQEILLVQEYKVWQNVVLGREPVGFLGRTDETGARRAVSDKIREFQLNLDPDAVAGDISVAARQKVEILKLLYRNVSILILDEPTAVLTPQEVPQLFAELGRLRDNGHTVIFISHRLDEVLTLSDRITVMRRGRKVDTVKAGETTKEELARMMVGRDVVLTSRRAPREPGRVICDIRDLTVRDAEGRTRLDGVNLTVRSGEIVGIAGVEGNGQLDLVNAIVGLANPTGGSITVEGREITRLPILRRRELISFVPQDRGRMGASLAASVTENSIMTHHRLDPRFTRWGGLLLNAGYARRFAERVKEEFSVTMSSPQAPFRSLSGGNQQKVILGRELLLSSAFVLLDQPTRGLDVGSIEYVHGQVLRIRDEGRAVLLVSADLEELFLIADRIAVLHRGRLVADVPVERATVENIGYLMLEGKVLAS
ncbi:MAG TPA: ABC transporter ATP-binding protein [Spirochaetia bacterium]